MTLLQALKSIQDIQIIITPKDDDKEQEIINHFKMKTGISLLRNLLIVIIYLILFIP